MKSNPSSRRVSFHNTVAFDQNSNSNVGLVSRSSSQAGNPNSNTTSTNNLTRGRPPSSNLGSMRIRPLTQLKQESTQSPAGLRSYGSQSEPPTGAREFDGGFEIPHGQRYQSEHSRRGSVTSETLANASANQINNLQSTATSVASLPNLTVGARVRSDEHQEDDAASAHSGPHPYDVILPGQEVRRAPTKARTISNIQHSTVGLTRSGSLASKSRTFSVGSRRFTQTAETSVPGGGTLSAVGTSNQAAALHARRFSTVARDPSAATISRSSSNVVDACESSGNLTENQRLAQAESRMFIISLRSLLGKDGGGEAVGRLLAFVLHGGLATAGSEISALLKQVLQKVPSLDAAYVTVHFHEIIEQLTKLGGLIVAEADIIKLFESVQQRFLGVVAPLSSSPSNFSLYEIYHAVIQKFSESPVYQSALLNLIDTVCKFLIASESLRDGMWTALSQSLHSPPASGENQIAGITEFLNLLFRALEQLTGGPVKPLVKHFLSWVAIADDILTKLAAETRDFLSKPFPVPATPTGDYVLHPLGYVYSPTDSAAKLKIVIQRWTTAFTLDQAHKEAFAHFTRTLNNVVLGVLGNSTFARFSRDLSRVWRGISGSSDSEASGTGVEGALEFLKALAAELIEIRLEDQKIECADSQVKISAIGLKTAGTLPSEISFSTKSQLVPPNFTFQSSTRVELKSLKLTSNEIEFSYASKSQPDSLQSGTFVADFSVDLSIGFVPKNNKLLAMFSSLPYYDKAEVKVSASSARLLGSGSRKLDEALWSQIRVQITGKVQKALENWTDRLFTSWLAPKPVVNPPSFQPSPIAPKDVGTPGVPFAPAHTGPEVFATARDRFKASVRNLTGVKTGVVLTQLQNPFSGPPSPSTSPGPDEDLDSKRKRRQSMAEYLTNVSRQDSTLPESIQRPPVAESYQNTSAASNLPNVFDDDEDELPAGYETMARSLSFSARKDTTSIDRIVRPVLSERADLGSVLSHRGVLSGFPTGEMSYEAYQKAEAEIGSQKNAPVLNVGHQEVASMAQSLSELATRDATTEEAIANPPTIDSSNTQNVHVPHSNMSMDRVTRHLSGLGDLPEEKSGSSTPSRLVRAGSHQPELNTRVVMADILTNAVKEDHTLPETQATGLMSGPVEALGVPTRQSFTSLPSQEKVPMSQKLTKEAAVDMTLPQNIACPPGTGPSYRAPVQQGQFTGLKSVRSMSTTLDSETERDFTTPESQVEMHKLYHQIKSGASTVTGLSEQEMKARRQSFKLSEEAMRDATLVDNIRRPPTSSFTASSQFSS